MLRKEDTMVLLSCSSRLVKLMLTRKTTMVRRRSYGPAGKGRDAVVPLSLHTGKVDINSKDEDGQTPLLWAAWGGHEAVVKLLLETGEVDANSKDKNGRTPLSWAAAGGHESVVR